MKDYLLDTNICIYLIKNKYNLDKKIREIGKGKCYISEVTVAELKYGVHNSNKSELIKAVTDDIISNFAVMLMYHSLDRFAKEKARLRKQGQLIEDFDILIGATAITNDMIMVTNNVAHLSRLENIVIEDWTKD